MGHAGTRPFKIISKLGKDSPQRQLISYLLKVQGKGPLRKQPRQYTTASWRAVKGPEEQDIRDTRGRRGSRSLAHTIPGSNILSSWQAQHTHMHADVQVCTHTHTSTQL